MALTPSFRFCRQLRFLAGYVAQAAREKFAGYGNQAVSSFFFLRFVCPAMVMPEQYEVIDSTSAVRTCVGEWVNGWIGRWGTALWCEEVKGTHLSSRFRVLP